MAKSDSDDSDMEDCKCITCQAEEVGIRRNEIGYEDELRKIISTGRNKEPFPDWDMVSGFFEDCFNPFFRGPNLYSCYRLMTNNYNRHQWLSGCPVFTNFFCFSCSLFGKGEDDACFMLGEIDLPLISSLAAKHSLSAVHLKYARKWLSYDQPADYRHLDEQEKKRIFVNDEIIRRRRAFACFIMNAIILLATQGLSFRNKSVKVGENDGKMQSNRDELDPGPLLEGRFYETIQFLIQQTENDEITSCLRTDSIEWYTLDVQTKFISAIADAIRTNIQSKLANAKFVSIIIDSPLSVLEIHGPRTSTILRFVDDSGGVQETFLGLNNVEHDHLSLFSHIRDIVELHLLKDKLVAIAFDGGSLKSAQLADFQSMMLESYPGARFVHCYGHMADSVILQSLGLEIDSTCSFLRLFAMIGDMFRGNEERQKDLRKFISQRSRIQQPLNFDRKLIHTLNHYRNQFTDYFIALPNTTPLYRIERNSGVLDDVCKLIKEAKSAFCLKLFSKIFLLLDPLTDAISSGGLDVTSCAEQVQKCLAAMKEQKNQGFDALWSFVSAVSGHLKMVPEDGEEDMKTFYKKLFDDILGNIINYLTVRFDYLTSMDFLSLLDSKRFSSYCNNFPEDSLKSLNNQYDMFQPQLREELKTLYRNRKLYKKNMSEFLQQFNGLHFGQPLLEVQKLVNLMMTLPLCPLSTEISKYKKVESYIRLAEGIDLKESLSDLSLIYLEKSYIGELDSKTVESRMTIDKIIDLFAEKIDRKEYYRYINPN